MLKLWTFIILAFTISRLENFFFKSLLNLPANMNTILHDVTRLDIYYVFVIISLLGTKFIKQISEYTMRRLLYNIDWLIDWIVLDDLPDVVVILRKYALVLMILTLETIRRNGVGYNADRRSYNRMRVAIWMLTKLHVGWTVLNMLICLIDLIEFFSFVYTMSVDYMFARCTTQIVLWLL